MATGASFHANRKPSVRGKGVGELNPQAQQSVHSSASRSCDADRLQEDAHLMRYGAKFFQLSFDFCTRAALLPVFAAAADGQSGKPAKSSESASWRFFRQCAQR
jgi:hypothetical protein